MRDSLNDHIKQLTETTAARERMESELNIAHDIQMSILPKIFPPFPTRDEFDLFALIEPAKEVGGDFYDFFQISDNHLCFVRCNRCSVYDQFTIRWQSRFPVIFLSLFWCIILFTLSASN